MLNAQKKFQRAHGNINVKINKNEINRFYQSGSAKVFYPKSPQEIKELVLVNTAGGLTSGDNFFYNVEITNKSKIFVTTQTAERVYKGINDNAEIKITLSLDDTSKLFWIPQELILFNNCNLYRRIEVDLKSTATFKDALKRFQLQQSVVLPVRTTPLTVQTPQSSGLPITQVIQNPTIQVASGGNISSTSSGSINATLGSQLPQQPSSIQNHVPAGTIQTVKIAGQTQVN